MNAIEHNRQAMKLFETMINTNDTALAEQLVDSKAAFRTPVSPEPLSGGKGYLSVVELMRSGFSDVQWKMKDMVAEADKVAVTWECTGTHDGVFMGLQPTGKKFSACVMNFYYFNEDGKITNDVAAEGMIAILRALGLCQY